MGRAGVDAAREAAREPPLEHDRELLAAFRAGNAKVLERVYYAYANDVFRIAALGFTSSTTTIRPERDPDEQRAIVHDVFVRAFADRARAAYDGVRPYRPYLMTIARNVIVDRVRARSVELARVSTIDVDALTAGDAVDTAGAVEENAEQRRLRAQAAAYLDTLDPESRRLVELRFEQDLSQADAAAELRVSRRRVRTLEARVIKGLRRFVKK